MATRKTTRGDRGDHVRKIAAMPFTYQQNKRVRPCSAGFGFLIEKSPLNATQVSAGYEYLFSFLSFMPKRTLIAQANNKVKYSQPV